MYDREVVKGVGGGGGTGRDGTDSSVNKSCLRGYKDGLIAACQKSAPANQTLLSGGLASPSHICWDPVEILLSGQVFAKEMSSAFTPYQY